MNRDYWISWIKVILLSKALYFHLALYCTVMMFNTHEKGSFWKHCGRRKCLLAFFSFFNFTKQKIHALKCTRMTFSSALPGCLSGECVGLMTWWLWVWYPVEANFLSGVFLPLTSAEACEKSSRWLWKESCETQETCLCHRLPWYDLNCYNGVKAKYSQPTNQTFSSAKLCFNLEKFKILTYNMVKLKYYLTVQTLHSPEKETFWKKNI